MAGHKFPEGNNYGKKFQPGSGGPGRPAMPPEVKAMFKAHSLEAAKYLGELLIDPKATPSMRVKAAEIILDRAYGKPAQAVDLQADVVQHNLSMEDKLALVREAVEALGHDDDGR